MREIIVFKYGIAIAKHDGRVGAQKGAEGHNRKQNS